MTRLAPFAMVALLLSLGGCAFHQTPYPMHDTSLPLSQTSVFSVLNDTGAKFAVPGIRTVDGKETSCFQVGCPIWVRVAPGAHTFGFRYATNFRLVGPFISHQAADLTITVRDMKPRHVYVARTREMGDNTLRVDVEDLGENPDYGITLGLGGVNQATYKVGF